MVTSGWGVVALVVGFPVALFAMLWIFAAVEAWVVQPDERAAVVRGMLAQMEEVDELERAVADLVAQVADDRRRLAETAASVTAGAGVS